jgi:hypothetical protein
MNLSSRSKLVLCVLIGVFALVGTSVVLALIERPPGIWVVWTVIQVPIGALFGVLAWLGWFAVRRRLEPQRKRVSELVAALVGAALISVILVLYWFDTALGLATVLQAIAVPLATIATFAMLRSPRSMPTPHIESTAGSPSSSTRPADPL